MNDGASTVTSKSTDPKQPLRDVAVPGARHALLLLVLINLFNYIDRQVLAAVEPQVRAQFFPDPMQVSAAIGLPTTPGVGPLLTAEALRPERIETEDAKPLMGFLSFAFLATYMLAAPIFGSLATRISRWLLIGGGVIIWSIASGASGLAPYLGQNLGLPTLELFIYTLPAVYIIMLLTRCCVGIGEAAYGPVAPDIISDLFTVKKRGQVLAWFYAAIPFGGALGYALGAEVVRITGDWRYAFYIVVPPGILLGLWCLLMREPGHGQVDRANVVTRKALFSDYLFLLSIPSYLLNNIGMTFMCFAMGGLAFWAPAFLQYRQAAPVAGMAPATFFGLLTATLGLLATIVGGIVGDAMRERSSGSYFLVSGTAMCVGFPMLLLMVALPFPLAWVPMGLFVFCLFFNTGPTNTICANVVHPLLRARGFALNILMIHLFGDAISPFIMGWIIGKENRFDIAFQFVSATVLLGGLLWIWGAWFLESDTARAPHHLPESPSA